METGHLLLEDRLTFLKEALEKYEKTEETLKQDVEVIRSWLETQKHLPEVPNNNIITNFLFLNKFSLETTKQKIDMYYTIREIITEFFHNNNPLLPRMQKIAEQTFLIPLPKTTEDGYRIMIFRINASHSDEDVSVNDAITHMYNLFEIRLNEDVALGDINIWDFMDLRLAHFTQVSPILLKKILLVLQKVFSNRVKQIHFVNVPSYGEPFLNLFRNLLKEKLAKRVFIHKDQSTLCDYIPRKILPRDYGGEELPFQELNDLWKKKLIEYAPRFDALDHMKVNENLRPTPLVNDDILGFHGNFKKLNLD